MRDAVLASPWTMTRHAAAGVVVAILASDALAWGRHWEDSEARGGVALLAPLVAVSLGRIAANPWRLRWAMALLLDVVAVTVASLAVSGVVSSQFNWPAELGSPERIFVACVAMTALLYGVVRGLTALERFAGPAGVGDALAPTDHRAPWFGLAAFGAVGSVAVISLRSERSWFELHPTASVGALCIVFLAWLLIRNVKTPGASRLGLALALSGFPLATFIVDVQVPLLPEHQRLAAALLLPAIVPCLLGMVGMVLGGDPPVSGGKRTIALAIALSPLLVLIAILASIQLELVEAFLAIKQIAGVVLILPLIVFTWLRTSAPIPLASPAAPSVIRATWTVPALFLAAAQVYISQVVGFEHRYHKPSASVAYGVLGAVALFAFVYADWRLLRRLRSSMAGSDDSPSSEVDQRRLEGFHGTQHTKTNLGWNLACGVLALGCVLWAMFIGTGTYGLV